LLTTKVHQRTSDRTAAVMLKKKETKEMSDRIERLLEEVEAMREDIEYFVDLPAMVDGYAGFVYRLSRLADRAGLPERVVPADINDPRRVQLAIDVVIEMGTRIRRLAERHEEFEAAVAAIK
jgi:hypothetical protein